MGTDSLGLYPHETIYHIPIPIGMIMVNLAVADK